MLLTTIWLRCLRGKRNATLKKVVDTWWWNSGGDPYPGLPDNLLWCPVMSQSSLHPGSPLTLAFKRRGVPPFFPPGSSTPLARAPAKKLPHRTSYFERKHWANSIIIRGGSEVGKPIPWSQTKAKFESWICRLLCDPGKFGVCLF